MRACWEKWDYYCQYPNVSIDANNSFWIKREEGSEKLKRTVTQTTKNKHIQNKNEDKWRTKRFSPKKYDRSQAHLNRYFNIDTHTHTHMNASWRRSRRKKRNLPFLKLTQTDAERRKATAFGWIMHAHMRSQFLVCNFWFVDSSWVCTNRKEKHTHARMQSMESMTIMRARKRERQPQRTQTITRIHVIFACSTTMTVQFEISLGFSPSVSIVLLPPFLL